MMSSRASLFGREAGGRGSRRPGCLCLPVHAKDPSTLEIHLPRVAANLKMLFSEFSPLERLESAAQAGFEAVEFLLSYPDNLVLAKKISPAHRRRLWLMPHRARDLFATPVGWPRRHYS